METKPIKKHLNRLLLDPNNYRFIDRPEYKPVSDGQIAESRIQQRTAEFLKGRNNENIEDLINSFKTNGVLRQDPIQVRPLGDNYVVIEGNRRTATLKYLYEQFQKGMDVGVLTESDFKSVELIELQGQDRRPTEPAHPGGGIPQHRGAAHRTSAGNGQDPFGARIAGTQRNR